MTTFPPCWHKVAWWPRGSITAPGQKGQEEAVDVSRPSHHLIVTWHSSESRCMFKPTERMAETQELSWGADIDNMRALLAGEAEETRAWIMWVSSFKDRAFCRGGV